MAALSKRVLIFLVIVGLFVPNLEGRLLKVEYGENRRIPALQKTLILNVLPKGSTPPSTPSNKGHSAVTDEKLIARHLIAIDRVLRSVPSPGVGH